MQTIPSSPPAFYFEILVFSYNLIIFAENPLGAPSARTVRPSFPNQTATDEKKFNVFFTIVVYQYLIIFDFIPMLIVIC